MKSKNELNKKEKKYINSNNRTYAKKDIFRKIENIYLANSILNKSENILFQKELKNKSIPHNKKINNTLSKVYGDNKNYIKHLKKNRTLNNTINKKYHKLKIDIESKNKKIKSKLKSINNIKSTNHSTHNYSSIDNSKNFKKILSKDKNNITNISVCLPNINIFHKNTVDYSPSFCKINKIIKKKKNLNKKNNDLRNKTFDYNYNINFDNSKINKNMKNKKLNNKMEKKMRYFLDYCKDDLSLSNSEFYEKNNKSNSIQNAFIKKVCKTTVNNIKNNSHKFIEKKRYYSKNNDLTNERFNTFNIGKSIYYNNISTINKFNKNNILQKTNKKKPRVDTFEYLAKILNSINTNNLMQSLSKTKIEKTIKRNESINEFRKKINKNQKYLCERRFKNNDLIRKYIEDKKKLFKINTMKKLKKEKEDDLKKYLELYKLQENIFNSTSKDNNYKNIDLNAKNFPKTKNGLYYSKNNKIKKTNKNNNNNEVLSSNESTIIDNPNYYQNIIEIQNIYNENNLFINYNVFNNDERELTPIQNGEFKKKNLEEIKNDNIFNAKNGNIEINKDKKVEPNKINIEINDFKSNNFNIDDKNIYIKYQNTLEKANKIIGGKKIESLISNLKNINLKNDENIIKENNTFQIDFRNDYSFKANDSNSNDINSFQTSKFCNSQVFKEEKEKNEDIKEDIEGKNIINNNIENIFINNSFNKEESEIKDNSPSIQLPPTIQLLSINDTLEEENKNKEINKIENDKDNSIKKYDLNREKLENYKEILKSLFEYLKLITQRNALNDIITYGDIKYKYKMGFEQLIILIKSIPFNMIRAIQQSQYYNFVFRQLFIPYISRAFNNIKLFSLYHKLFTKINQIIKFIFKKIIFRKILNYIELTINKKSNNSINKNRSLTFSNIKKSDNKNEKSSKSNFKYSESDISESKEIDSIEWDNNFINIKPITNRDNSNIIKNFTKIYKNDNSYSADFNISIQEIVFEEQK